MSAPAPRVPLLRPIYFLWVLLPALAAPFLIEHGLPHLLFHTTNVQIARPDGRGTAYRLRCLYLGPAGLKVVEPHAGRCPTLRLLQETP